jgi:hypothetical protein
MGNKLTIPIYIFLWSVSISSASAQTKGDSVEYIKVSNGVMSLKKVNSKEVEFKFRGAKLNELLSLSDFFYSTEHPLTTRSGFLLGWYFKLSDHWRINIYFEKGLLKESENVYLNDLHIDSVGNEKIKRIEIVKQRL